MEYEIRRIVEYECDHMLDEQEREKSKAKAETLVQAVCSAVKLKTYDFSKADCFKIKQGKKNRKIKKFASLTVERELCVYLKRQLDKLFIVKYPVRNNIMAELFSVLKVVQKMKNYVIVKFDFKDFFNSLSAEYVYEEKVALSAMTRTDKTILKKFTETTQYCFAGMNTSNVLAEIIAVDFDERIKMNFKDSGLIFYSRYIDDAVLILNRHCTESDCCDKINSALREVFYNPDNKHCSKQKVTLNEGKFKYLNALEILKGTKTYEFEFLGYRFIFNGKDLTYGITEDKRKKYCKQIRKYIRGAYGDEELLRNILKAFACRTVYLKERNKTMIWKAKGLISNYNQLRNVYDKIEPQTIKFFEDIFKDGFAACGYSLPYYLLGNTENSIYNINRNLRKNKTLLFVDGLGIQKADLAKMCGKVGISAGTGKDYDSLLRSYLIKVKVGY